MIQRITYLRDQVNVQTRADGTPSRGNPIACIASEVDRVANVIRYAISVSHPKDSFNKPLGRKIAFGRLRVRPQSIVGLVPKSGHDIARLIMQDIMDNDPAFIYPAGISDDNKKDWLCTMPVRVVMAAMAWLDAAALPRPAQVNVSPANGKLVQPLTGANAAAHKKIMAMTNEEIKETAVEAGIYTKDGGWGRGYYRPGPKSPVVRRGGGWTDK